MIALYALDFNDTHSEGTIALTPPMRKPETEADFNDTQHYSEETMASLRNGRITEEEYWEKYYNDPDVVFEWNNGYLEEKPVSDFATYSAYEWFGELLGHYSRTKQGLCCRVIVRRNGKQKRKKGRVKLWKSKWFKRKQKLPALRHYWQAKVMSKHDCREL